MELEIARALPRGTMCVLLDALKKGEGEREQVVVCAMSVGEGEPREKRGKYFVGAQNRAALLYSEQDIL